MENDLSGNHTPTHRGRGTYDITDEVQASVRDSGVQTGLCHLFLQHTSASLIICENADPSVRSDIERFLARLIPDGDRYTITPARVLTTCRRMCDRS